MPLCLTLKKNERLVVNGAVLSFEDGARVRFHNKVALMREGQIMHPDEADTPARRIYFALQSAYMASQEERETFQTMLRDRSGEFARATTQPAIRFKLDQMLALAQDKEFYQAMKIAQQVIEYEDFVLEAGQAAQDDAPLKQALAALGEAPQAMAKTETGG